MGGWWRSADLREGCALAHSGGRCAPERLRAWTLRDSGRVPLSPQKNAKDGEPRTQLAALRQVSAALQRILLQAKRKPAPGIRHIQSNSHWPAGGLEGVKRLFYWQVKALFLSEGRRKSPGAGDSVWGLTGALAGGGMMREG